MVEHEEEGCVFGPAAHSVDTGWYFGCWSHTGLLAHSLDKRLRISFLRPGAKIVGYAFTEDIARYGRRVCVEIFRVGGLGFCAFEVDEICPQITSVRFTVEVVESIRFSGRHRDEVVDMETQQLPERSRVTAEANVIPPVHYPREERHQERPAMRHVPQNVIHRVVGDEVEVRGDNKPVGREVGGGMGEVYGDVRLVERLVEGVDAFEHPDGGGGFGVELERPPALPVQEDRGLCLPARPKEFV